MRLALYWAEPMPGPLPIRRDASPWPMVVAMLVASVGVHLVLWPVGNQVLEFGWPSTPLPPMSGLMEVSLVDPEADAPEPPDGVKLPGQLVQPDFVPDERPPERDTNRISEFDSRVDKETKAPNRKAAPEYDPRVLGEQSGMPSSAREGSTEADTPPHALPLGRPTEGTADDLGHPIEGELPAGDEGAAQREAGARALRPGLRGSAEAMRKTFGGSGTADSLEGVEEGTQNILNSERFRFASFFNRMRDQVAQHWDPNGVMARVDADGRTYGRSTRTTLLHVKLTPKGAIQKINVTRESGVTELDKEAIRSFHQAAPFVNPPPEMVDASSGLIEFDFLFILEEGKGSIRRYFR
jgi:TonB C terminal